MNPIEKALFQEETGIAEPTLCIRTNTRIDAGRWWRRTPVWLCVAGNEIVMFAVARRRYFERIAIAACKESRYNHATGELVLVPGESLRLNHFSISPRDALGVLKFLNKPLTETKI